MGARVRGIALAAALVAAGAGIRAPAAAGPGEQARRPMLRVESTTVDLGLVAAGRTARATFVFHNDGNRPVRILRVKPG